MKKQILVSTIASLALVSGLQAGTSTITAGADINGSVHSAKIQAATLTINASDSNITGLANVGAANYNRFITYVPNVSIGSGNLITIKVNNGAVLGNAGNNLWLTDANSTAEQNATGAPVVAKMTDFVNSGANYSEMTFKFIASVNSGAELILANVFDTNATLPVTVDTDYGLGARSSATGLVINAGLNCAENVTLEVVKSKDQSGQAFEVPNTAGVSSTGILVNKGVYIELGAHPAAETDVNGFTAKAGFCPTFSCTISIPDGEKAFGSTIAAAASTCPTCTETTTNNDLTCDGALNVKYNGTGLVAGGGVTITSVNLSTTGTKATMGELSSIKGKLANNTATTFTIDSAKKVATAALTAGVNAAADNNVSVTYSANGTSVLTPNTFDMAVKVNGALVVDTIKDFMTFKEDGTTLKVAYLSANPAYRSFVRVTSDKATTVQAVVTTEDGATSSRVNVTKADGSAVSLTAATGGALVVEAADILRSATDAGFTGTGLRFNATLYVKTAGSVDAVAYQLDGGSNSQRYLPVSGATGGGKN